MPVFPWGPVLAILLLGGTRSLAYAQPSASGSDANQQDDSVEYRELIAKALREHQLENFSEAKAYFQRAHEIQPNARTLRGLGLSCYELRSYAEAIVYMQQALASSVRPLTPAMRAELERLIDDARHFVARVAITLTPSSAELTIDSLPPKRDRDGHVLLDPGLHEVVVEGEGFAALRRTVQASSGDQIALQIDLSKPTDGAAEGGGTGSSASSSDTPMGAYLLMGVGGAAIVAGGVFVVLALSDFASVEDADDGTRWADVRPAYDRAPTYTGLGIALLAGGLASAAAGLVWHLQLGGEETEQVAWIALRPGSAHVGGRF